MLPILITFVKSDLLWSSLWRIVRQGISIAIPFMMLKYLNLIRKIAYIDWHYAIPICLLVSASTTLRDIFS